MNRQGYPAALLGALLLISWSCQRGQKIATEPTDESQPVLTSFAQATDPSSSVQLLRGFHGIEHGAWRWTMGRFSLLLLPPAGASKKGATLTLKFTIPDAVIRNLKFTEVSVLVQSTPVGRQTYTEVGEYTLQVDVPATLLKGDAINVECVVNPSLAAGVVDARELGVVFLSAGLEAK